MKTLEWSSFIFFTNFIHNTYYCEWVYAWLFLLLTSTSVLVHSGLFQDEFSDFHNKLLFIDKTVIASVVLYGTYLFYQKSDTTIIMWIPVTTVSFVIWIYIVGYFAKKWVFDPNQEIADRYHVWMHIISSIGHHSIVCNM